MLEALVASLMKFSNTEERKNEAGIVFQLKGYSAASWKSDWKCSY